MRFDDEPTTALEAEPEKKADGGRKEKRRSIFAPPIAPQPEPEKEPLLMPWTWHGVVPGWKCGRCSDFYEKRDDAVLHVLKHVPAEQREEVLETLMKEEK